MEKKIIKCRMNVSKIDKAKLYKGKDGYLLDFTMIEVPTDYSDWMIVEDVTKEEREAGKKGTILGNGKNLDRKPDAPAKEEFSDNEDLPF